MVVLDQQHISVEQNHIAKRPKTNLTGTAWVLKSYMGISFAGLTKLGENM